MFALAVRAFGVLLLGRGYAHHAAHVPIAAQPGGQHAQHSLRVKPVRLGPACAAVDQDAGGLEHVSSNACAVSNRCSQNPSRPASKQHATSAAPPSLLEASDRSSAIKASSATVSPPSRRCCRCLSTPANR